MKYNQNRRIFRAFYAVAASMTLLTGFTSLAAESNMTDDLLPTEVQSESEIRTEVLSDIIGTQDNDMLNDLERKEIWNFTEIVNDVHQNAVKETKNAAQGTNNPYLKKVEEEKKAAEEARRIAEEEAAREAAEKAAQEQAVSASASEQELLAALIFCEAGNQPYEGQVAVGAVVMNRVRSGSFPNTITDVIYQSGQFTPAMTGWLDSVLASDGYTNSAMQAAADALAGSNPIGDCLYFSTGGGGYQLGDHYFR